MQEQTSLIDANFQSHQEPSQEIREFADKPGYGADRNGGVWSRLVRGHRILCDIWRPLKLLPDKDGYLHVGLWVDGRQRRFVVSRLILETFVGPCPDGMECCHDDGNPANNRVDNLRWDTHANNLADREKHGTAQQGERANNVKLTRAKVDEIRRLWGTGKYKMAAIGRMFGVTGENVSMIVYRKTWNNI